MSLHYLNAGHISQATLGQMGSKAANLHQLLKAGFPVPLGFVLFAPETHLQEAIDSIGGFPVAVRSSGAMEDLPQASFAGLYETYLFIQNIQELEDAIHKCFDSLNSFRVKEYLKTKNIHYNPEKLTMSVLVQKMVDAKVAGVLFTMNPLNGYEEECYLEYCEGVGERLVSGHVTPSRVRYDWINETKRLEEINQEGTKIDDSDLEVLIKQSIQIQSYYGRPSNPRPTHSKTSSNLKTI